MNLLMVVYAGRVTIYYVCVYLRHSHIYLWY